MVEIDTEIQGLVGDTWQHEERFAFVYVVLLIFSTLVPQFLSLSGSSDVQPGRGGELGRHRRQPAASAGQRDPVQRRAAESNQQGTQVSHKVIHSTCA